MGEGKDLTSMEICDKYYKFVQHVKSLGLGEIFEDCEACNGKGILVEEGFWDNRWCIQCSGMGSKMLDNPHYEYCKTCDATGRTTGMNTNDLCPKCNGTTVVKKEI